MLWGSRQAFRHVREHISYFCARRLAARSAARWPNVTAILGISAFYHDSAAALLVDGELAAAVQEERFTRKKYDARFPSSAIDYCLKAAQLTLPDIDYVAFYEKPLTKFDRLLETYLAFAPEGFSSFRKAMPLWLREKVHTGRRIRRELRGFHKSRIVYLSHHESHAASAFFPSPYDDAAILTMDGVGEWASSTFGSGHGNHLSLESQITFPHSLGLLYTAFTYYCGFQVNSGEYKLMGLAPYGRPVYRELILERLIDLKPDGSFWLDMRYFNYCQGLTMTNRRFNELFGGPPRQIDSPIEQRHMDIAASIQAVTEEAVLRIGRHVHERTGQSRLVMAGGVALNCVANGRLLREGPFTDIWIQPAAGDAGGAAGAAFFVWHQLLGKPRRASREDRQAASLLGPQYGTAEIRQCLDAAGACYHHFLEESALLERVADLLVEGKVVGWFHGRAEFGPRALGARSILGDPRSERMQSVMNLKIKFREGFRPFAPCVLKSHVHEWFQMRPGEESPYMLLIAPVASVRRRAVDSAEPEGIGARLRRTRSEIPAVTHVDYSARVQTVDERHGRFFRLLGTFHRKTGCPCLVNTSFNLSWEPIVLKPSEAYYTFMQSEMDALVLEDYLLMKREQPLGMHVGSVTAAQSEAETPWADPGSGEPLIAGATSLTNPVTGVSYAIEHGVARLFVPTSGALSERADVTDLVKQFYEKTPFPNYEDIDNTRALLEKARAGTFARLLNEQIPFGASVLEVGCGTGQLTNFLAIAHRSVLGIDVCWNSLALAERFKQEQGIERATFAQMNLFRPALKDGFFDVVLSNGVLHHTADCRAAFRRIGKLVKPGGYLVVGLYHWYGRMFLHYPRREIVRWMPSLGRLLDPHFGRVKSAQRHKAWYRDQYEHPHETCHTMDEVLEWMAEDGLEFVNSIPKPTGGAALGSGETLFEPRSPGTRWSRLMSQLAHIPSGYREGGFFIVIARRRTDALAAQAAPITQEITEQAYARRTA
jgi:carbamoyltransferase